VKRFKINGENMNCKNQTVPIQTKVVAKLLESAKSSVLDELSNESPENADDIIENNVIEENNEQKAKSRG
jgi:hypothetical protein